ncbi:MAG: beta-lactamase domain protein [Gemmatimonadetes bacterium]|nr:beta-lactamase domain protein [Gemmatimonadota bacterium]
MKIDVRTVGALQENCYLVVDEGANESVLVDPGADGEVLVEMLRSSGTRLSAIWLSHAHVDHIGGIAEVRRHFDVPVHLHPLDLPLYRTLAAQSADVFGIPFEQPDDPDAELADGQVLRCGGLEFTVMHVPGHAPGHVTFNGHGVALSGDLLFAGSIGRTDLPFCNPFHMDASLARFATLPEETLVYPGHGPATSIGEELESNPFLAGRARTLKR